MTSDGKQPDVLVVEDDPIVLDELVVSLRRAGLACAAANNAWEALELVQRGIRPTVMVCDIRMPELDGLELAQRLARLDSSERPEIIFVSGHAGFDEAVAAMRLGARDLLTKPIDLRRLIQIIKEIRLEPPAPAVPAAERAEPDDAPSLPPEEMPLKVLRQAGEWSRSRGADLPVFVVTGHGTVEEEQKAMALGARLFLRKPLDLPVLLGHVRAALQPATAGVAR